jgi:hypothetical protein
MHSLVSRTTVTPSYCLFDAGRFVVTEEYWWYSWGYFGHHAQQWVVDVASLNTF